MYELAGHISSRQNPARPQKFLTEVLSHQNGKHLALGAAHDA